MRGFLYRLFIRLARIAGFLSEANLRRAGEVCLKSAQKFLLDG
jgi:hypothetical protein